MRRFSIFDFRFSIDRPDGASRRGFSVAEVMISLVILGLGLLFIAAALPVGIDYVRQSTDLASGEAAGQEAVASLTLNMRTARRVDEVTPGINSQRRRDNVFRPRQNVSPTYPVDDGYEPFFKVRPFELWNISAITAPNVTVGQEFVDDGEGLIRSYMSTIGASVLLRGAVLLETDFTSTVQGPGFSLAECPALGSLDRVFPPVTSMKPLQADQFLRNLNGINGNTEIYRAYTPRYVDPNSFGQAYGSAALPESKKGLDRRLAWTAFYRRVDYDKITPGSNNIYDGLPPTSDDAAHPGDPLAYEIIVVVSRRPTLAHRYPKQFVTGANVNDFTMPKAVQPNSGSAGGPDSDRIAPTPWLVTMLDPNGLPPEGLPISLNYNQGGVGGVIREMKPAFVDPPRLVFHCSREVGAITPPGSILIPAANDDFPITGANLVKNPANRAAGFVPHQPGTLPIYRVLERINPPQDRPGDPVTLLCENNGAYPWLAAGLPATAFPFWVVPPPFTQRGSFSNGQPIYEQRSTIVAVIRQTIHLQEIP